jgi:TolB-like protein
LAFDTAAASLTGPDGAQPLRPKAASLLELLLRNAGRTLGKDEIFGAVWAGVNVSDETLTQTVHELRRALGEDAQALVTTVPRRGYLVPAEALDVLPPAGRTLAVLPFVSPSQDLDSEHFAAGLWHDLTAALGLIHGIELRADPASAEVELTGSVRAAGAQIRVTARLAERAGGRQLWSDRFDGPASDIFALQDEITRRVAIALQVELTTGDYARLWDGQTGSLAAWQRFIVANGLYLRWSEADNRRARDLVIEALHLDPDYVAAKVLLGKTWWIDARFYMRGAERQAALAESERLMLEVLVQRPGHVAATMMRGGNAWLDDRHDEAIAFCRQASIASPSDSWVVAFFGMVSAFSGDLAEAIEMFGRATRLSPQVFSWVDFHAAHARAWLGDDAAAQAAIRRYIAAVPQEPWGHVMHAVIHGFAGRSEAAEAAVAEALRHRGDIRLDQVRQTQRYRDPARLDRVLAVLARAGLPD